MTELEGPPRKRPRGRDAAARRIGAPNRRFRRTRGGVVVGVFVLAVAAVGLAAAGRPPVALLPLPVVALSALPRCGNLPAAAAHPDVVASLSTASFGGAGSTVSGDLFLSPRSLSPPSFTSSRRFDVAVLQDGQIVGGASGPSSTRGARYQNRPTHDVAAVFRGELRLLGCPAGQTGSPAPTRPVLPPGRYDLVAMTVLDGSSVVLSPPTPFTVVPATVPGPDGAPLPVCGLPSGPSSRPDLQASLTLTAKPVSGAIVTVAMTIAPRTGTLDIDTGSPREVGILRDGQVVGFYSGGVTGIGYGGHGISRSNPLQVPATPVLLSGCPTEPVNSADPGATRRPLPPGDYQLQTIDNGPIVSDPLNITIIAAA